MKKVPGLYVLISFMVALLPACKKDQEKAPLPVDGLRALPGKYRALVEFEVPTDATSGKVFYGTGNFMEFTVSDPAETQRLMVEGLPEDDQILRVITYNSSGVNSDPKGVRVSIYGDRYESTLKPRKWMDQVYNSPNSIELVFAPAEANEVAVRVIYSNTSGRKDSVEMAAGQTTVPVTDIDTDEPYYYYSVYKPTSETIDEFWSPFIDLRTAAMLDLKKEMWSIAGVSGESGGNAASNLIDNNIGTMWQTGASTGFPQWVSVDMGSPKIVDGFYIVNAQGNERSPKDIRIEMSDDNSNWFVVLETTITDSYLRQRLPLGPSATGRYFKITVLNSWNTGADRTQIAEIDVYNVQNISAENGKDEYIWGNAVSLVNAMPPFKGDNSNPFPAVGDYRMQKLMGWIHNETAVVSYDDLSAAFGLFSTEVWGLPNVVNGKVYQSVQLQPGQYALKIHVGHSDGPVDIYGVVAKSGTFPDYADVPISPSTYRYSNLAANQNKTVELVFAVTEAEAVNIGIVYNTHDQYSINGTPWTAFYLRGFELFKIVQ